MSYDDWRPPGVPPTRPYCPRCHMEELPHLPGCRLSEKSIIDAHLSGKKKRIGKRKSPGSILGLLIGSTGRQKV